MDNFLTDLVNSKVKILYEGCQQIAQRIGVVVKPLVSLSIKVTKEEVGRWEVLNKGFKDSPINRCKWWEIGELVYVWVR